MNDSTTLDIYILVNIQKTTGDMIPNIGVKNLNNKSVVYLANLFDAC